MQLNTFRLGLGTWKMGETPQCHKEELEAVRYAAEHGNMLLDTAEMYGEGRSERLIGEAIKGLPRESVFLVSKVYPHNASKAKMRAACQNSLQRMGVDFLDLYLLHWRGSVPLEETVEAFEGLKQEGLIRAWGVSNFDVSDMEELWRIPAGKNCAANQVMYHLGSRGIQYDLLPWMHQHGVPLLAYCPLAHSDAYRKSITEHPAVKEVAEAHGASVFQVMLAFIARQPNAIALPKSASVAHVKHNLESLQLKLTDEDWQKLDEAFPPPTKKTELDML